MLNWIAKLLLTSTSLAPVALVYAWVMYTNSKICAAIGLVALAVALVLTMLWLLSYSKKHLERSTFKVTSIEAADRE